MATHEQLEYGTFEASLERSRQLEKDIQENPNKHRMLTEIGLQVGSTSATCLDRCRTE